MVGIKPPSLQLPIPYSPFVVPERKGLFSEGYKFSITLSNHACIIFETKQALFLAFTWEIKAYFYIFRKSLWNLDLPTKCKTPCSILSSTSIHFHVHTVGTLPLGKHVARSSWWRVAHIISRTIIIRIPLKICMVQLSYPDHLKERQTTFQLLLSKEEQTPLAERRHADSLHNTSG